MAIHSVLIKKLKHIGFSDNACEYVKDYFSNRMQSVLFNGSYSKLLECGPQNVFQGTINATMFYLIYIADQPFITHIYIVIMM